MKSTTFYVVVGRRAYSHSPHTTTAIRAERLTQKSPSLDAGEVAVRIKLTLDEGVFVALLDAGELVVDAEQITQPAIEQVEPEAAPVDEPDDA